MIKFDRQYILEVQAAVNSPTFIRIEPPFTLEFDITRKELGSASIASFRIYNLSQKVRNQILINQYDSYNFRQVNLQAGYGPGPSYPLVFTGFATRAWSIRDGNNFITQIEAFDGGKAYLNARIDQQFPAGTPYRSIIIALVNRLKEFGIKRGTIGNYTGSTGRGFAANGSIIDILTELTGGGFFIDNGVANCLGQTEGIGSNSIPTINASAGLLNTPVREENFLIFDMLFEPKLFIGQLVNLESATEANYSGQHKVGGVRHKGTISEAVCGDAITTLSLYYNKAFVRIGQ